MLGRSLSEISSLRYQRLYGTATSLIFAREHKAAAAIFAIFEFHGPSCKPEDINRNVDDLNVFVLALSGVRERSMQVNLLVHSRHQVETAFRPTFPFSLGERSGSSRRLSSKTYERPRTSAILGDATTIKSVVQATCAEEAGEVVLPIPLVDTISQLGTKLGFEVRCEVAASEGAWVDVVWFDQRLSPTNFGVHTFTIRQAPVVPVVGSKFSEATTEQCAPESVGGNLFPLQTERAFHSPAGVREGVTRMPVAFLRRSMELSDELEGERA